ncbi:hypothetical protein ACEWY4_027596 [Coilia grayii]|uniref:CUB domain-containing protein n=1 Tax=Coilia grayii TaxID=363190 RepID=A0ABD1IP71_9TELE
MTGRMAGPSPRMLLWLLSVGCALQSAAGCGGQSEVLRERRGVLFSPAWPLHYPPALNCSWDIQAERGELITISFRDFDVEESVGCVRDWLQLSGVGGGDYRLCGSLLPPPSSPHTHASHCSSTHTHTPPARHRASGCPTSGAQGFRLSYIRGRLGRSSCDADEFLCANGKCVPRGWRCNAQDECGDQSDERGCVAPPTEEPVTFDLCPGGSLACRVGPTTRCLPPERRCDGVPDCPGGADELACAPPLWSPAPGPAPCTQRLRGFYGAFASPDFLRPPPAGDEGAERRCSWTLDTGDARPLLLRLELRLGEGDALRVFDGLTPRPQRLLLELTRHYNARAPQLESSRGQMTLIYRTAPHSRGRGFSASYRAKGYCFPGDRPCGGGAGAGAGPGAEQGCFSERQRCDGYWHCPSGRDEEGCAGCPAGSYPCEGVAGGVAGGEAACYAPQERCDNQKQCAGARTSGTACGARRAASCAPPSAACTRLGAATARTTAGTPATSTVA